MKTMLRPAVCAVAVLLSCVSVDALTAPAAAQADVSISFDTFHDQLSRYGDWVYSDRWGEVWIPDDVSNDFRPYDTNGYWVDTDEYGWYWMSNYPWGDIPFHYGRWVFDPDEGWMWIPGYVWSPAWVVWRSNGQYVGWMPMPPDRQFLGAGGPSFSLSFGGRNFGFSVDFGNTNDYYGYSQWYGPDFGSDRFASLWVFVGPGHLADRDFHRYAAPRGNYATIIDNTRNITHYTIVNNYVVNRSVDPRIVQRASGHPVPTVHAAAVIRQPQFVTRASQGQQVQVRMRTQMPRGTGIANSAPRPSPQVVQSLSDKAPRRGHGGAHLYTRTTVTNAPLPGKPGGPVPPTGGPGGRPNGTTPSNQAIGPENRMNGPGSNGAAPGNGGPNASGPVNNGPENGMPASGRHRNKEGVPSTSSPGNATGGSAGMQGSHQPVTGNPPSTLTPENRMNGPAAGATPLGRHPGNESPTGPGTPQGTVNGPPGTPQGQANGPNTTMPSHHPEGAHPMNGPEQNGGTSQGPTQGAHSQTPATPPPPKPTGQQDDKHKKPDENPH